MHLIPKAEEEEEEEEEKVKQMEHERVLPVIQTRLTVFHFATLHVFSSNACHTMQNYNI